MSNTLFSNTRSGRNYHIEGLRVIAMLLIILGHSIIHTNLEDFTAANSFNSYFTTFLRTFANVATNLFVLISGYFQITSKFSIEKWIRIWLQTLFYCVLCFIVFSCIYPESFSLSSLFKCFVPLSSNQYWFVRVYLCMYLLSPFLNIAFRSLTKAQFQTLLIISFALLSMWRSIIPFATTINSEGGNSLLWFIYLYATASYLRLHANIKRNRRFYLISSIALLLFSYVSYYVLRYASELLHFGGKGTSLFTEFTSFPMYLAAVSLLCFGITGVERKSSVLSRCIILLSSGSFSVYLIHENIYIKNMLWRFFNVTNLALKPYLPLALLSLPVLIYLCCFLIDFCTFRPINKLLLSRFLPTFSEKIYKLYLSIKRKVFK